MAPKGRHAHVLLPNANALSATPARGERERDEVGGGGTRERGFECGDGRRSSRSRAVGFGRGEELGRRTRGVQPHRSRGWGARVETGGREGWVERAARGRDGFARGFGRTRDEAVHVLQRGARDELEPGAQRQGGEEREGEKHGARREAGGAGEGPDHRLLPIGHVRVGEIGHRRHGGALGGDSLGAGHCAEITARARGSTQRPPARGALSDAGSAPIGFSPFLIFFRLISCVKRIWTNHGRPFPRRSPSRVSSAKESHSAARSHHVRRLRRRLVRRRRRPRGRSRPPRERPRRSPRRLRLG